MAIELINTTIRANAPTSKDLNIASATEAKVYAVQYNTVQNNGTLTLLPGDVRSGGADNFLQLQDTPSSYTGQGGKLLAVNQAESGIEFIQNQMGFIHTWTERVDGALSTATDVAGFIATRSMYINSVYIRCREKGTSGTTIIDVNKNGTSIYANQNNRPTLPYNHSSNVVSGGAIGNNTVQAGDLLTFDIDSAASGARDLDITVEFSGTATVGSSSNSGIFFLDNQLPPDINQFSWINQGNATATYSSSWGIYLQSDLSTSSASYRILAKSLAYTSNYRITIGFFPFHNDNHASHSSLILLNDSNAMITFG
ncbi:MAG: hypothetical protein QXU75_07625, partial [Candidatus Methanomethylicaceae archaeon]